MKEIIVLMSAFLVVTTGYIQLDEDPDEDESFMPHSASFPQIGDIPLLNRKIFKGQRVTIREHPYIVSIRRLVSHYLTGALLTRNIIITVAHPLDNVPIMELGAVVGENYSDRGTKLHTVLLVIIHEDFDPYTLRNDIAILRLYEDVTYSTNVKEIHLFNPHKALKGTAFVTAWGRCDNMGTELCLDRTSKYYPDEKMDPMLRFVQFPIGLSSNYCDAYKRHAVTPQEGMMCAGVAREHDQVTSCLGVPGAAMVIQASLAGLLSWGFGCGYSYDLPLIYTDIKYYAEWITYNIKELLVLKPDNLTELFQATKAALLSQWLLRTRIVTPNITIHTESKLEPLDVDYVLVKLRGKLYDVRDFIMDSKFHEQKREMYRSVAAIIEEQHVTSSAYPHVLPHGYPHIEKLSLQNMDSDINDSVANDSEETTEATETEDQMYLEEDK